MGMDLVQIMMELHLVSATQDIGDGFICSNIKVQKEEMIAILILPVLIQFWTLLLHLWHRIHWVFVVDVGFFLTVLE